MQHVFNVYWSLAVVWGISVRRFHVKNVESMDLQQPTHLCKGPCRSLHCLEHPTLKHVQNIVHARPCTDTVQLHFFELQGVSPLQPHQIIFRMYSGTSLTFSGWWVGISDLLVACIFFPSKFLRIQCWWLIAFEIAPQVYLEVGPLNIFNKCFLDWW